jgi:predicted ATP-grasp superfamily ATP-dependent carboligase
VLVLRVHHGSLGLARSLGRLGLPVYAVDAQRASPSLSSRYWQGTFTWDFRREGPDDSVRYLLHVGEQLGGRPVLVPTCDDTAYLVANRADELAAAFRFPRVDPELVRSFSDKRKLHELARRHGVPTANAHFPASRADVERFAETAVFPVMLKGIVGLRLEARTGVKMVITRTAKELLANYDRMEDPAAPNLMVQEYIPGGDDTIWMFNGYFDERSNCRFGVTGRKLRQHPIHVGSTSLGICERNETVDRQTREFMAGVGYRGILDIGYRYDARDGRYKLLDPNPRIGSSFRLFVGRDGLDVARALYLDLNGLPVPASPFPDGRKWIVEDQDIESTLDYMAEGTLGPGGWAASLRGVEEGAWFAWDDPAPFVRIAGRLLGQAGRHAWHRVARRRRQPLPTPQLEGTHEARTEEPSRRSPLRNEALPSAAP